MTTLQNTIPKGIAAHYYVETNYPGQHPRQMPLYLAIDWRSGEVEVIAREYTLTGTPMYEYHGHVITSRLPDDVDASRLHGYVTDEIIPAMQPWADAYQSDWNGSNHVATFDGVFDKADPYALQGTLDQLCEDAPTFDEGGIVDVGEWLHDWAWSTVQARHSDEEVTVMAEDVEKEEREKGFVFDGDVEKYLREIRDEKRAEEDDT